MTITAYEIALYSGALFILFLTPGPVWVAIIARALSGGFNSAWPLALGVVVGDVIWPVVAVLGVGWIVAVYADFLIVLKWVAVAFFFALGMSLIRNAGHEISQDRRLTRPGMWAGFVAGLVVIMSNPKAVLFYMGVLPGFFDLGQLTAYDIAIICTASFLVPLGGNLSLAIFVDRARALLSSPEALRRTNVISGWLLIGVGGIIAVS